MRKQLACLVLLCSAVSTYAAEPQRWCGDSNGQHAELVFLDDGPVIKMDDKVVEHLNNSHMIIGTLDFQSADGMFYKDQKVIIDHDRAFWPCG